MSRVSANNYSKTHYSVQKYFQHKSDKLNSISQIRFNLSELCYVCVLSKICNFVTKSQNQRMCCDGISEEATGAGRANAMLQKSDE